MHNDVYGSVKEGQDEVMGRWEVREKKCEGQQQDVFCTGFTQGPLLDVSHRVDTQCEHVDGKKKGEEEIEKANQRHIACKCQLISSESKQFV